MNAVDYKLNDHVSRITLGGVCTRIICLRAEFFSNVFPSSALIDAITEYAIQQQMCMFMKNTVQCRLREHQEAPPSTSEPRSVNGVVASLIRSIEANRYTVPDTPAHVRLNGSGGQDATTQTSPFSISRSSSFDWINEPAEVGLRDLATPLGTPRSELPAQLSAVSKQAESSSETDDADREVAEMTQNVDRSNRTHSDLTVIENEDHNADLCKCKRESPIQEVLLKIHNGLLVSPIYSSPQVLQEIRYIVPELMQSPSVP
ncbi:unnamed protein product [Angiostrongylus costaricensis]|uniref:FSA_C domain-containing protein n=1 Tax=Angiostrongylus costaricensis TaxID=334426 RepID=A0A158PGH7_ANGCS|nr:unnamed protein product [Angiostrongylus costaricensis]